MKTCLRLLVPFLALVSAAHAVIFSTETTLSPGYSVRDNVISAGGLNLSPGTYTATSWIISGPLTLTAPGTYVIAGRAGITGPIQGPSSGTATLQLTSTSSSVLSGSIASNVRIETATSTTTGGGTSAGSGGGVISVSPIDPVISVTPIDPTINVDPNYVAPVTVGVNASAPLVNISTRATLAPGGSVSPGFVVGGKTARRVMIRAIGPGLAAFGIDNGVPTPVLTVFRGSAEIASNSRWGGGTSMAAAFSAVGAFPLASNSSDAALVLSLAPGAYTAQVAGGSGEVLVEVYFVD